MKAFLLAAGKGTRLRPYTHAHPKCLIPIHGKPLLRIWIDLLAAHGVTEVLINTHHHSDQVERFVSETRPCTSITLRTVYEPELRGSAGTVWENRRFVADERDFIIAYADNLTDLDLSGLVAAHRHTREKACILTMALMHAPNPTACGIATLDKNNHIIGFTEKPKHPESDLANAGIYVASKEIYEIMKTAGDSHERAGGVWDLGHHILPLMTGKMRGFHIAPYFLQDVGTPEAYQSALDLWPVRGAGGRPEVGY